MIKISGHANLVFIIVCFPRLSTQVYLMTTNNLETEYSDVTILIK